MLYRLSLLFYFKDRIFSTYLTFMNSIVYFQRPGGPPPDSDVNRDANQASKASY